MIWLCMKIIPISFLSWQAFQALIFMADKLSREVMDSAWSRYASERRKGTKAAAKAVAREHGIKEWRDVEEYLKVRVARGSGRRKAWIIGSAAIAGTAIFAAASYISPAPAEDTAAEVEESVREMMKPSPDGVVSLSQAELMPGVKRIVWSNSQTPDVFYCMLGHPQWARTSVWNPKSMESFQDFCLTMNNIYGVSSFIGEGVGKVRVAQFLSKGEFDIPENSSYAHKLYLRGLQEILKTGDWQIYMAKDTSVNDAYVREISRMKQIHKDYEERLSTKLEDLMTEATEWRGGTAYLPKEAMEEVSRKISPFYDSLHKETTAKLEAILTPEMGKLLYKIQLTDGNELYAANCAACKKQGKLQVILSLGPAHAGTLPKLLEEKGLTCAVIELEGHDSRSTMNPTPEMVREFYLQLAHPKELIQYGIQATEDHRWKIKKEK